MVISRVFVVSLGFDITTVTYLVGRTVFEDGDRILFVLPEADVPGRTEQMLGALNEFLQGFVARGIGISYEFLRLSDRDLLGDLSRLLGYINSLSPESIYVWAVGGTRSMVSLLTIYSLLDPRVLRFTTYSESNNVEIAIDRPRFIEVDLSRDLGNILVLLLDSGGLDIYELSGLSGLDYGKTYRLIRRGVRLGLISRGRGRRPKYSLTGLGRVYLELLRQLPTP